MKKTFNKFLDETYFEEVLSNGLKVNIFYKPEFKTTVCSFGTPYGALKINEKVNGKTYHFNPGIAHFLEHKLFENEDEDIMTKFSSLGANVNAFTSYKSTVYYFSKTGEDIEECLNLLLDFVQSLNISEDSVNKEKGIIKQEISMYEQMPDTKLINETYKCLYHFYPLKYDIGGDEKSVYAINKKELDTCYKINYHPCNMILNITSPIDPKKIIKIVKNNQNKKKFAKASKPLIVNKEEPVSVKQKRKIFKMPISTNKHVLAYKFKPFFKDANDVVRKEWAVRILLESYFSYLNPQYQKWLDDKIINDYFGYDVDFDNEYAYILFYIENDDADVLKKLVKDSLKDDLLTDDKIIQLKRRYIGSLFDSFNDVESFNNNYIREALSGIDFFKSIDDLNAITKKEILDIYHSLDFSNYSYISMIKK